MIHSQLKSFFIGLVLGLVIGFILGWWLCNRDGAVLTNTTSVVDTIKYYKPIPYERKETTVNGFALPRMIFAPADTVVKTKVVVENGDSVEASFPVEQREYKDSTYYAIVSGAVVGDRRPTLDYIETYYRTTTSEVMLKPKKITPYVGASLGVYGDWQVGVEAGVILKEQHAVGVEYTRSRIGNSIEVNYYYIFKSNLKSKSK